MTRALTAVLMLVQFRPIAVRAACLIDSRGTETCAMMTMPLHSRHHAPVPTPMLPCGDCPATPQCDVGAIALLPAVIEPRTALAPIPGIFSSASAQPRAVDLAAPPVPPPNA